MSPTAKGWNWGGLVSLFPVLYFVNTREVPGVCGLSQEGWAVLHAEKGMLGLGIEEERKQANIELLSWLSCRGRGVKVGKSRD